MNEQLLPQMPEFSEPTKDTAAAKLRSGMSGGMYVSSRDEMNLAEFPLTVLSTRVSSTTKTLEFSDTIHQKNGEVTKREWIITGADKFGLPTSTDDDVVLGLICLSMDQGFRERKVYFTRYELLKILRWSTEGRSYSRLTRSLDRLSGVRIRATNAFFDNDSKAFQTCNFGIIDSYEINDERGGRLPSKGENPNSYFVWSEVIYDSFKTGYIKKLDLDFYFSLKSSVSRRLYRYLDKHFFRKPVIEKPLMLLAFEKLGLSRSYKYVSSVKQQIEPAAQELVDAGFLSSFEFIGRGANAVARFTAARAGSDLHARSSRGASLSERTIASTLSGDDDRLRLSNELIDRGLSPQQVQKLLAAKPSDDIAAVWRGVSYYDRLLESKDEAALRNPLGFLYRVVENPQRVMPSEQQSATAFSRVGAPKSTRNQAARPELRVVRAERGTARQTRESAASLDDSALRLEYERCISYAADQIKKQLSEIERSAIYQRQEKKLSLLRGVLDARSFEVAVEGCVKEEIIKSAKLPSFEVWKKSQ